MSGMRTTPTGSLTSSTALVPWDGRAEELKRCQDALGDIEIYIYESWEFETITKDAARRFLAIADICEWDMDWVTEMRRWAG